MLKHLRFVRTFYNYYSVLSTNVCYISHFYNQSAFLHVFPIQNKLNPAYYPLSNIRYKSKGRNKNNFIEDSDDEFSDDELIEESEIEVNGTKIKKLQVRSLRLDHISKAGFGINRRKFEQCLFSNKLQINGRSVRKKGAQVSMFTNCEIKKGDKLELYPDIGDNNDSSKNVSFVVKNIEANLDTSLFNVYISFD